jgi:hypothetical protein
MRIVVLRVERERIAYSLTRKQIKRKQLRR